MNPNNTTFSEPADSPEPLAVDSPISLPGKTETHFGTPQPSSVRATAAWVEQIELRPQSQITTSTTSNVQPRAIQEMQMDGSPSKKAKKQQEHDGPTAKDQKYDRQLRLWGANGQNSLEKAHVCLVNNGSGAVGAETLKNLVLPGIGNFTIIDSNLTSEEDLGVNFFLDESQLGCPRGESLRNMLSELNPDVMCHWAETLGEMSNYDLFIWTAPSSDLLTRKRLEEYCATVKKPLITINSQGFYAYFQIQFNGDFPIVETHPEETALRDLRVMNPWRELEDWAKNLTTDLDKQSNHKHGHIPWLALVIYYINLWREQNKNPDGTPVIFTGTFKQKKEIQKLIQAGQRYDNGEGGEENYDQAFANVMKTARPATLSDKVKEIFNLCDQEGYRNSKDSFWSLARALKTFHEKNGRLPIAGFVPDMKAESDVYVQLQNLYKAQAGKDIEEVKSFINPSILSRPGLDEEISTFCKNAETLDLIRHSQIPCDSDLERQVYCTWARSGIEGEKLEKENVDAINSDRSAEIEAENCMPVVPKPPLEYILLALRSMDTRDLKDMMDIEQDTIIGAIEDLLTEPKAYIQGWHALQVGKSEAMRQVVREVWRAKGGELHNTASLVGGMVSQEVIKLLTKQYIPVENLVVWDGIFCRMGTFRA